MIPRQLPVNLDICCYEIGGIIGTKERDTECVANRTVGAVAGDEIGDVGRFLPAVGRLKRCAHPVFVLLERNEFNVPFHLCEEQSYSISSSARANSADGTFEADCFAVDDHLILGRFRCEADMPRPPLVYRWAAIDPTETLAH
jgi:hypothetical protein